MAEVLKLFQALARRLADEGIDTLFGVLGDANLYLVDSFVRERGGRYVGAVNEAGAVLMALGYAAMGARVGVATVTHGPAVTNTLTGLIDGVKSSTPLVLLCGDTAAEDRENLQDIPQRDIIVATGAGFEQVRAPATALRDLATAIRRAEIERRPVALNIPADVQWHDVGYEPARGLIASSSPTIVPCGEDLDNAVGILAASKRPVVLAGRGVANEDARAAVMRLADRLDAPLATTLKAKDLFREIEYNLGIYGTLSTPAAVEAIVKSDCLIAFGASLNKYTTSDGAFLKGKRVIQVGPAQAEIARYFQPDIGLIGDVTAAADSLVHWLDQAEVSPSGFRGELSQYGLSTYPINEMPANSADRETIDISVALDYFNKVLPENRAVVTDGGRFVMTAWQRMEVHAPQHFLPTHNFGSIGLGMGYAIGASFAVPGRPVVMVTGDGGFMFGGLAEFHTAVREKVDLVVIVCNDGSYGAEHVQLRKKSMDPALTLFDWPDFASLASALGGTGMAVRCAADMEHAAHAISTRSKPLLIDLKLDPDRIPWH